MKKVMKILSVLLVCSVLIFAMLTSACNNTQQLPRLATPYTYNPGAGFQTNIKDEDPRRTIRCSVIFEVIDEDAVTELADHNFVIRNAVLIVLGELTREELTVNRDLQEISQRLVDQVNDAIRSNINLVVGAYFTEFVLT